MTADFIVVGGGMAGAAAGYFLAEHGRVIVLERESAPGYHSTGRSAALYTETYGNAAIRALTVASGRFFRAPPAGFADVPLLRPRGLMMIARASDAARFERDVAEGKRFAPNLRVLTQSEALALCPALRDEWTGHAFLEPDAMDMDVHAIHQGFLRGLKAMGGSIVTDAAAQAITAGDDGWQVETRAGRYTAPILVNAAGAWADEVATLAGLPLLGFTPKRRTAVIVEVDPIPSPAWPMVVDIAETFYFKPESGRLLISPADETMMSAADVQPDEIDIAEAVARLEAATRLTVRRVLRKWAGLRTFAPDRTLVIGPDALAPGFVWMAGQGGYGIQTAAAAGRAAATLVRGGALPSDLAELGLVAAELLPNRLRTAAL
ncbi:MAG TPA: FAD-dependent oxidoreductase [Stellaceae bacterium]|nr:FAD-dependent oxidoreductase [Stellaceae bacterium]